MGDGGGSVEGDGDGSGGASDPDGRAWLAKSREKTAEVLRKRKQLKRLMHMAAERFNTDKKHWVEYVQVRGSRSSVCLRV